MRRSAVVTLALGLAAGCAERAVDPGAHVEEEKVIARVDGESVTSGLFEAYLRDNINLSDDVSRTADGRKASAEGGVLGNAFSEEVKSRLLDRFLLEQALFAEAKRQGIKSEDEGLDKFARAVGLGPLETLHLGAPITEREYLRRYLEDCYIVKRYLDTVVLASVLASDADARAWYDQHASEFSHPDRYRLRVIHADTMAEAQDALRQIRADPSSFVKVARSLSEGVEGEQGKDLGTWRADQLPDEIAQAVAPLRQGQVTNVIKEGEGFNLFWVEEKTPGGTLSFEQVKDRLKNRVTRERRAVVLHDFLESLRQKVKIEIREENLGFHYASPIPASNSPAGATSPPGAATPPRTGGAS